MLPTSAVLIEPSVVEARAGRKRAASGQPVVGAPLTPYDWALNDQSMKTKKPSRAIN